MEELSNIANGVGDIGSVAESLNPTEEITAQIEDVTGGLGDVTGQVTEQVEGTIGNIFGQF